MLKSIFRHCFDIISNYKKPISAYILHIYFYQPMFSLPKKMGRTGVCYYI